jgi:hypothetical protein
MGIAVVLVLNDIVRRPPTTGPSGDGHFLPVMHKNLGLERGSNKLTNFTAATKLMERQ